MMMNNPRYPNSSQLELQKIPKIIWQTSRSFPHKKAIPLIKTWIQNNPDYQWLLMDDVRCDQFIRDNFSDSFYQMFVSLPHGVMKADVWRVAVVYAYGGIYADTDCQCMVAVNNWIAPHDELIVGVEVAGGDLLNYAFAAAPKHPALLSVLNNFVELYNTANFMADPNTPIQNFGQYGFSNGILRYYKLDTIEQMRLGGTTNYYNEAASVHGNVKFICYQDRRFTNDEASSSYIVHHVASIAWRRYGYESWRINK